MMPSLVNLRPVVDRLKSLQTQSTVAGNMSGQLRLLVESDALQLETVYSGLVNPSLGKQPQEQSSISPRSPGRQIRPRFPSNTLAPIAIQRNLQKSSWMSRTWPNLWDPTL